MALVTFAGMWCAICRLAVPNVWCLLCLWQLLGVCSLWFRGHVAIDAKMASTEEKRARSPNPANQDAMVAIKRVAVIGAGPGGAIAVDALAKEKAFDLIRVFERREAAGGCWLGDTTPPPLLTDLEALANRTADPPVDIPDRLPAQTPKLTQPRFADSSVYPYLETNVDAIPMSFSQEPIPSDRSPHSVALHGEDTPFRHWTVIRRYLQSLLERDGYEDLVSYSTTVERVEKVGHEWKLTLRRDGERSDYWWTEWFDAVVVASGHYSVPLFQRAAPPRGPGENGLGRQLPVFDRAWFKSFLDGHERRKNMWQRLNAKAWDEAGVDELNLGTVPGAGRKTIEAPPAYDWDTIRKLPLLLQALQGLNTKAF
ncbi:dimethylaniline monooxygenase [Verticillium alfalfae VaMs.102]|uniref:Dimethylaniline monooxygenase n=1 Tax=Verticillium alfalfae (strain VaMs.102 / ATCC MYA-4576 / FGSC 10136) TaxID=526221 RepID=C9SGF4_VERA1|nr:dimethylaniline monooxygenase [Verticillium alfalfae VaMs.102]EEY17494.1 dimethylaniline monooxygenase [Verticillium alfalfae VaMs.102]